MKILFNPLMPTGIKNPDFVSDYQSDMVFHGLVKTLGLDLHTNFYMWWHHSKEKKEEPEIFKRIWGKGFTMYGLLEPNEYTRKQQETSQSKRKNRFPFSWPCCQSLPMGVGRRMLGGRRAGK